MPTEDRRVGKQLPDPVVPPDTVCFTIQIPNAVQYRAAFLGQINVLGQALTWDHPTDGTDCEDCELAAQLWRNAIYNAVWSDECGSLPMSCDDVADCIENDPATRAAVGAIVPAVPIDGMTYPPGVPLTPSQMGTRLNEIDDCVYDAYWAQCEQFVDYMVDLGQDVLDQIAAYSAALDAGENVPMGQFLGKLKNSSTAGKVVDFLQWVLTVVKAQYEAQDNEANRDAIKCAVFCAGKDDCLITIQGTLNVLNNRLGGILVPSALDDMVAMVNAFMTAAFDPALTLDLWILFLMSSAKTAGMFGLQGIDETLNMVLAVAVNDANNDWETKCEDCVTPEIYEPYMMAPALEPGGTVEKIGNTWKFRSQVGSGGLHRICFKLGAGGGSMRFTRFDVSVDCDFKNRYVPYANPSNAEYATGLEVGAIVVGQCWGGILYGEYSEFTIELEMEQC